MTLLRYDLDRLGWLEFERLIQALLKEKLGLGVEAWGGRSDGGRDAFFEGSLRYPGLDVEAGPFVFQVKFVEGANAAGARPFEALRAAVAAEARRIVERRREADDPARHYALLTNAPVSIENRRVIIDKIREALPGVQAHIHDGNDVCTGLDGAPALLQTYPQIAGLAQLLPLLECMVGASVVSRSGAAIREAEELAKVFVTTRAFERARLLLLTMLKDDMDLSGRARHFPKPSELAVNAAELSRIEKGRILYRHAKTTIREKAKRDFIRLVAEPIVDDPHFTPERIRRLVEDQSSDVRYLTMCWRLWMKSSTQATATRTCRSMRTRNTRKSVG